MRKGGLAAWSIHHPVSTVMLTLTAMVLGVFALSRLSTGLLPQLIYPQIGVRVIDPGVSAAIMEDRVTRQLEEQLAITEDAISVESTTTEGNSRLNLHFDYGKDIDVALRDASTRLDRARRFLPDTIDPPVIFKYDPSQIPAMEFIISSSLRDPVALRAWVDYVFSRRFINLPGVAAAEIGGGLEREIHVLPDQRRLAGLGLSLDSIINTLREGNRDEPSGRLRMAHQEYTSRTAGRLDSVAAIAALPVSLAAGQSIMLSEVAQVLDTHEDERLRVRYNGVPGVKMSIQKQPEANTVEVADLVKSRLAWLQANGLVPQDVRVDAVSDQSLYVRQSLANAMMAALTGALLAMLVVYVFLGNVRGTLIIGSAIPISIMLTFVIMGLSGLTFNIMTLGGLALGVGMLIDNTIVMLENIARHKQQGQADESPALRTLAAARNDESAVNAAAEVNNAVVAATTTNLAAVLPFLFIGGLVGLLFRELIITISAAIVGSLIVALTLVPALAARMKPVRGGSMHERVNGLMAGIGERYARTIRRTLMHPYAVLGVSLLVLLLVSLFTFDLDRQEFLPQMDDGRVRINVTTDTGVTLNEMDERVRRIESIASDSGDVHGIFTLAGGRIFGRTEREIANESTVYVQLVPRNRRSVSVQHWVKRFMKAINKQQLAGVRIRARVQGIRGVRTGRGEDDIGIRVEGADLGKLAALGDGLVALLSDVEGIRNVKHSIEDRMQEFAVAVDRQRAMELGIDIAQIGRGLRIALEGVVVGDYLDDDRGYPIRVRLPRRELNSPAALGDVLLFGETRQRPAIYLRDVAKVELVPVPASIMRENQVRIVEVSASLTGDVALGKVTAVVHERLKSFKLPVGYNLYFAGSDVTLQRGRQTALILLALALFLVFVVMTVQYESLRSPAVIMAAVPFSLIGVGLAMALTQMRLSMPVWLGIIMLVGIVVNNAIILVEYIRQARARGTLLTEAIVEAGSLRLRPILMTTLTTVVGMLPLALGLGEGAEMLQPLAVAIVGGLGFSLLVTLFLVPVLYWLLHRGEGEGGELLSLRPVA